MQERKSLPLVPVWLKQYPPELLEEINEVAGQHGKKLFFAGGVVRDWLLGVTPKDLDLVVSCHAVPMAVKLAAILGGTYVALHEQEGVARVVWHDLTVDLSEFRKGSRSIEDDLRQRDFTINAMAIPFALPSQVPFSSALIIDPTGGQEDLRRGVVRACHPGVFLEDPLRLLRAFRFVAVLGFRMDRLTEQSIGQQVSMLGNVAAERIHYELDLIMASCRAGAVIRQLDEAGILGLLFPELKEGQGLNQPASHHLDVFFHNLEALSCLEEVIRSLHRFFPQQAGHLERYCADLKTTTLLKWAAIFHDLGKPYTAKIISDRITFYGHDRVGIEVFGRIADRLKWSRADAGRVERFIGLHMWPFHLNNARKKTGLTGRACLRLFKRAGDDLPGLFLLAMADSLAGKGPKKPANTELDLARLYDEIDKVVQERIRPLLEQPRLLTGHDLIEVFGLIPGPHFAKILTGLEQAQLTEGVATREDALSWVAGFLARGRIC